MEVETILSILICTTSSRSDIIKPLLLKLYSQIKPYHGRVEIIINDNEFESVGKKRNDLLFMANGEWQTSIDSDDDVSDDYISKIMTSLELNPDCVGISGFITTDGSNRKQWHISKDYDCWFEKNNTYFRCPNHISPIRTSIARMVGFKDISFGEDFDFSIRALPLLHSEVKVYGELYHYKYLTNK